MARVDDRTTDRRHVRGRLQITLLAAALDFATSPCGGDQRRPAALDGGLFVNFVGPIAYFLFGRKRCC